MLIRQACPRDYPVILALQAQNTPENLSRQQRQQGFIVSKMDEAQLKNLNNSIGILVAEHNGQLAGFVCLALPSVKPRPAVVDAMIAALSSHSFAGQIISEQRVFLYGPVCLAAQWRGKGVLRQLFSAVKNHTRGTFDIGALFIDEANPHSLAAHVNGLGMTMLGSFDCQDKHYRLLAFASD